MRRAPAVWLLLGSLALLAGCACEGSGALAPSRDPGGMSAAPPLTAGREGGEPAAGSEPPAPPEPVERAAPGGSSADATHLGLFAPVLPTLGMDTHSTHCDPFDDPYQVCL